MMESHIRGRAEEGIASLCLAFDSFTCSQPVPSKRWRSCNFPLPHQIYFWKRKQMFPLCFVKMFSSSPSDGSRFPVTANQKWLELFGDLP